MKHLVEFPLDEGGSIIVEVDEPESEGTIRAARGDAIVKAKETLEHSITSCQLQRALSRNFAASETNLMRSRSALG